MKYLVCQKGFGTGCDYTIGCNMTWSITDFAGSIEELAEECTRLALYGDEHAKPEEYDLRSDDNCQVEQLVIVPFTESAVVREMTEYMARHNIQVRERQLQKAKDERRKQYDKLKAEFEA